MSFLVDTNVVSELRKGVGLTCRRRDDKGAGVLDDWLLPVTVDVAEGWGGSWTRCSRPQPGHGLTMVTRNTADIGRTGVPGVNPFRSSPPAERRDQPEAEAP